jgi:hypothetical protein
MTKTDKIIEIATGEIGIKENPPNSNNVKYNDWIYNRPTSGPNFPWCGAFVSWCYAMAGFPIKKAGLTRGFVGCQFAVRNMAKWGRQITVPQPGDVVFFDWDGDGRFDHTGIFIRDLGGGLFLSIEGNTAFGNDSNGGEVMRRADRKYKNAIFVRPTVIEASI